MGGSRSCQRQTCTASRTVSGLAVLAFALRLVPRCRANLAPQAVCLLFKSRRVRSIPKASNPRKVWGTFALAALVRPRLVLRSRDGQTMPCPRSLYLAFLPKAFCIPLTRQHLPAHNRCKFPPHRTKPPSHAARNLHAIAHSVLVKFSFSRTQPPRTQSVGSRFSPRSRFTSERRK